LQALGQLGLDALTIVALPSRLDRVSGLLAQLAQLIGDVLFDLLFLGHGTLL
jgi:hypothetical protein